MKTLRFRLVTMLSATVMLFVLSLNVFAASGNSVTQDGLTAKLITDKDSYKAGEPVKVNVHVDNHTGNEVSVFTQINVPEGVKMSADNTVFEATLYGGETWTAESELTLSVGNSAEESATVGAAEQTWLWIILTVLVVCGAIALWFFCKNKSTWLSMMLCIVMVGDVVVAAVSAQAVDVKGDIPLSCTVQMEDTDTEISAVVSYVVHADESETTKPHTKTESPSAKKTQTKIESSAVIKPSAVTEPHIKTESSSATEPTGLNYPEVSKETFKEDIQKSIAQGHPWILGKQEDFDRVKANAFGRNIYLTDMYAKVKAAASQYLGKVPSTVQDVLENDSYNSRAAECLEAIMNCAFVYKIEGLEEYAERAYEEAEVFANLRSWGRYQYIDNNYPALGLAICYDWLYDWLGADRRDKLVSVLKRNHFDNVVAVFEDPKNPKWDPNFDLHYFNGNNMGLLNNTMTFLEAMAIADVDLDYSAYIMEQTFKTLEKHVKQYYPEPAWYEGLGYWMYTGVSMARWLCGMETALGTTYGLTDMEFMTRLADFPIYGASSRYAFIINDVTYEQSRPMRLTYALSTLNGDPAYEKYTLLNDNSADPLNCLTFKTDVDYDSVMIEEFELDALYEKTGIVTMRNTWSGNQELFGAMYVADANLTHGVMNSGTIQVEALGEQWICNPGKDEYKLPGYFDSTTQEGQRWKYYFSRAEANSCLVINPGLDGGQIINSGDILDTLVSEKKGAYAVTDLTKTYKDYASSYKRGVMLADDRTKFIVQDEAELFESQEVYSFFNLNKCDNIEISEDCKSVILTKRNKKLMIRIACDADYEISVIDASPLPSSPQEAGNKEQKNIKRLALHFPSVKKFNLRLEFTPYLVDEEISEARNEIIPIAQWSIPAGELDAMGAQSVILDGVKLETFIPQIRCYTVEKLPANIEYVADESRYEISEKVNNDNSAKYLVLKDKATGRCISYMFEISFELEGLQIMDVTGYHKLAVSGVTASADDGNVPGNTIDGDMKTRWSAPSMVNGEIVPPTITWELSEKSEVYCIAAAFNNGKARSYYFDVAVSVDGETWDTISANNASSGKTNDFEYYPLNDKEAKFVRLTCYGNSQNHWCSPTEIIIYGKPAE